MSPEQAKGKHFDKRSDIFSFGVVLYELLTGLNRFHGETVVESLGAVLNKNPDWAPIPARAERLLNWCLEKDRKRRLASISDARRVLDEPAAQAAAEPATIVQIEKEPASKLPWVAAGVLGVALAALAAWTFLARPASATRSGTEAVRFTLPPPAGATLTANRAGGPQLAVSPDGRYVASVADPVENGSGNSVKRVLWVRALGSLAAQRLDKTDGATSPFWSPDSKNIGFFAEGKLKRIAVSGGSPINLCDVENDEGGTWFQQDVDGKSDGWILFTPNDASPIQRVPATGGVPTPVTKLADGDMTYRYPQFLPDGNASSIMPGAATAKPASTCSTQVRIKALS